MKDIIIAEVIIVLFIHLVLRPAWNKCVIFKFLLFTRKWYYDAIRNRLVYDDDSYIALGEKTLESSLFGEENSYAKTIYSRCERYMIPKHPILKVYREYFCKEDKKGE